MVVSRGLIIAEPWIDHILEGRKDWEMRSTPTSVRGWFGLIKKGSGQVYGLARLVDCGRSLTQLEMIANVARHRIPESMIQSGAVTKWTVPWKLEDIISLKSPVPYVHKSGAVTWVNFDDDVQEQLSQHISSRGEKPILAGIESERHQPRYVIQNLSIPASASRTAESTKPARTPQEPVQRSADTILGRSRLTGGNLRNDHFYLTDFLEKFPANTIGGNNRAKAAERQISIDWGGPQLVFTDIDRSKRMFRSRAWVGQLFAASNAQEGDEVVVSSSDPYNVTVRIDRSSR